mmetsp:Transcript_23981/g.58615  ORF Transcript_23981/g.58615 Transcript_23981/m.58615 type:complete len:81 (+) Transcript_23981:739-981(+)
MTTTASTEGPGKMTWKDTEAIAPDRRSSTAERDTDQDEAKGVCILVNDLCRNIGKTLVEEVELNVNIDLKEDSTSKEVRQ